MSPLEKDAINALNQMAANSKIPAAALVKISATLTELKDIAKFQLELAQKKAKP